MQHTINCIANSVYLDQPALEELADLDPHYTQGDLDIGSERKTKYFLIPNLCNEGTCIVIIKIYILIEI